MKRTFAITLAAALAGATLLTACEPSGGQNAATLTARVCPATQAVLGELAALPLAPEQLATLDEAKPVVAAVCAAGAVASAPSLRTLHERAGPALLAVVKAAPMDEQRRTDLLQGLALARIAVSAYLASAEGAGDVR